MAGDALADLDEEEEGDVAGEEDKGGVAGPDEGL